MYGVENTVNPHTSPQPARLTVQSGTVHAVLGENGAGKTTLMNVLAGVYKADEGHVRLDGIEQNFSKPADAIAAGVGMVYQEFRLIPTFTVAENVALGAAPAILAKATIENQVAELAERFGLQTEPGREIWQLSMGERQRVEILKALWRDARVLILDEPTAVLTPAEADELGRITKAMANEGRSIIFISHKLDEVKAFAARRGPRCWPHGRAHGRRSNRCFSASNSSHGCW